jgi:hypothetical protein
MPFSVNPPCGEGYRTVVKWQFSGRNENENSFGDDYKISWKLNPAVETSIVYLQYNLDFFTTNDSASSQEAVAQDNANYAEPNYRQRTIFYPRELPVNPLDLFNNPEPTSYSNGNPVYLPGFSPGWRIDAKVWNPPGNSSIQTLYAGGNVSLSYVVPGSLRNVRYSSPQGDVIQYVLEIYKEGQVIATDSGGAYPVVSYSCEPGYECPPNTCDVLCGDTICCYNSDGISVMNFPNV